MGQQAVAPVTYGRKCTQVKCSVRSSKDRGCFWPSVGGLSASPKSRWFTEYQLLQISGPLRFQNGREGERMLGKGNPPQDPMM